MKTLKYLIKRLVPPILYDRIRALIRRPIRFSPSWNTVKYEPMNGIRLYFDATGPWQKRYLNGNYDRPFFDRLRKMDMKDKIVYDIGAHIGFHSFYFARLIGPKGKVFAFEPHPGNIRRMKMILDENPDIKPTIMVLEAAISDKNGTEEFNFSNDIESGRSSGGFIDSADTIWDRSAYEHRGFQKMIAKTIKLDSIGELGVKDGPDLIKIDVEGAESLVLEGAKETIKLNHPIILLEVHSMSNMFNVLSFFNSVSYKAKILDEEKDGRCFLEARYEPNEK